MTTTHRSIRPSIAWLKAFLASLAILAFVVLALASAWYLFVSAGCKAPAARQLKPSSEGALKPSKSKLRVFKKTAVCTDIPECPKFGKKVLLNNGSAVDAAIAVMFCNGLLNRQSMGLGGGFLMTVYINEEKKAYSVNAREKAPLKATVNMFGGDRHKSLGGPLAAAVPGELRGMWAAHQRWGKLPWKDLVKPIVNICNEGFILSLDMYHGLILGQENNNIKKDLLLREMYVSSSGEFHKPGTFVKPSKALCSTLEHIAKSDGHDLYNGTLAKDFLDDLQKAGSIITAEDLENYEAKITDALSVPIGNGEVLYTPPPPGSGVILASILNILSGYQFDSSSIATTKDKILTYHRVIEAFKYAYATRSKLGDGDFLDLQELISNVTSPEYGTDIRLRINDMLTSNDTATYGVTEYTPPDSGTSQMSIIAANGDAVSVTSSINCYFGAGFTTLKTGIVMNNVMDDFSAPGITNSYALSPSKANLIAPGKRPLSSMSPSIIVDKSGEVKLVVGASGGTRITTAVAMVTMRMLWFNQSVKEAVDEPRFHHQTLPMELAYQFGSMENIMEGLRAKGHGLAAYTIRGSNVCALYRNKTAIYGNSDYRKEGDVAGFD